MASESNGRPWDVFLSFSGKDTRNNFTSHLHYALDQKGIRTFIDDKLRSGEQISDALLKVIEESKISIIIFSENYASSSWCLDELLKILDCKKEKNQIVLPVFYKVDPSDVRHQINSFQEALAKLDKYIKDDLKMQSWRDALHDTTNLSGHHLKINGNESEFIQHIVQVVSRIVNPAHLDVAKYLVGIKSRVWEINSLLGIGMNDRRMVGIIGVGGIGKTTIAKAIYNLITDQFEGSCFLKNVRENSKREEDLVQLQNTMLSEILGDIGLKVVNADNGIYVIKRRLSNKRVLLILDDVDQLAQLEKLAGSCDWFGLGSRIIITTRDKSLLTSHGVGVGLTYVVKGLNYHEALELFSCHAFKRKEPIDDYVELTKNVISYCEGLPLALRVLGSALYDKSKRHWTSALVKYKKNPHKSIQEILEISYDGLDDSQKSIFLDVACFFKGESVDYVTKILCTTTTDDDIGVLVDDHDIGVLVDKCLVTIEHKKLGMHDLVQDMGREIIRKESPKEPGERSRLWFHEDVVCVLEENTGTHTVEGILVDLPEQDQDTIWLSSESFLKMRNLRLFIIRNAKFFGQLNYLSNQLRMIDWSKCPVESLPPNFHPKKLAVLRMRNCFIKQLDGFENLRFMTIMDISECKYLTKIPDLSGIPNLEKLNLSDCKNLVEVHNSVGFLGKLVHLVVCKCSNLRSFPRSLKLRSLISLNLDGCSSLNNFPEIEVKMERTKFVSINCTPIKELPSSIGNLIGLEELLLEGCENLMCLPSNIHQLQHLRRLELGSDRELFIEFLKVTDKDNRQSMPSNIMSTNGSKIPSSVEFLSLQSPTKSSISNDSCSSIVFPALQFLNLRNSISDSDFLFALNCFSTLERLDLSESNLVSIPACINRFVGLRSLTLRDCKQLQEILQLPPNIEILRAKGCISLERILEGPSGLEFSACKLPRLHIIDLSGCHKLIGNIENAMGNQLGEVCGGCRPIFMYPGNKIPDWFSHRQEASNPKKCHIDIKVPSDLDGEIKGMVVCAVIKCRDGTTPPIRDILHYNVWIREKEEFKCGGWSYWMNVPKSDHVWLYYVPEKDIKLQREYRRVEFSIEERDPFSIKSCGVHLVCWYDGKAREMVNQYTNPPQDQEDDGVDFPLDVPNEDIRNLVVTKRRRDDNLESILYPQQKIRRASASISEVKETPLGESQEESSYPLTPTIKVRFWTF